MDTNLKQQQACASAIKKGLYNSCSYYNNNNNNRVITLPEMISELCKQFSIAEHKLEQDQEKQSH